MAGLNVFKVWSRLQTGADLQPRGTDAMRHWVRVGVSAAVAATSYSILLVALQRTECRTIKPAPLGVICEYF
jgi:hypothetical protein